MSRRVGFSGTVLAVQPRGFLQRDADGERVRFQGYLVRLRPAGAARSQERVGLDASDLRRHEPKVGDQVAGEGRAVRDRGVEVARIHKLSTFAVVARGRGRMPEPPPFCGVPDPLSVYEQRLLRPLDPRVFETVCLPCVWACELAVEQCSTGGWVHWCTETFCCGSPGCALHVPR